MLTCDHYGRLIPQALGDLGVAASELERHIAWDIGIAGVAERLASQLDAQGLGIRLPPGRELDPHAIARALEALKGRDYPWGRIRELLARAGGAPAGVGIVMEALGTGR